MKWAPILAALLWSCAARADGGVLLSSQAAAGFIVSVFAAPEPLRAGRAEVTVLVQTGDRGTVVLDAAVTLRLRAPDGSERELPATPAAAGNRLLEGAVVDLDAAGRWQLTVTARQAGRSATIACPLDVAPARSRLEAQWPALALPPLAVALFAAGRPRRRPPRRRDGES